MTRKSNSETHSENQPLPENPGAAIMVGMLFKRLGGSFTIGADGRRWVGQQEPCAYRMRGEEYPQLPGAEPWEEFLSVEQWRGATRMLMYLLERLDPADKDYLFSVFAPIAVDDRDGFDFRKHMQ